MKNRALLLALITASSIGLSPYATCPVQAQAHRGKMDTDGILSPGEIRNPRINYGYGWGSNRPHREWNDWNAGRYNDWRDRDPHRGSWNGRPYSDGYFSSALSDGVRSGRISRDEERELRGMNDDLRRREYEYRRDGYLSDRERDDLEDRSSDLRKKFDHEMGDGEKRRW